MAADLLERVHVIAEGRTGFRLFHEALAEHLRTGHDYQQIHAAYTDALVGLVPQLGGTKQPDWLAAPLYVRSHLASHAALAGDQRQLEGLVNDARFLIAADPEHLSDALRGFRSAGSTSAIAEVAQVMYLASKLANKPPGLRASYLELEARKNKADRVANLIVQSGVHRPWSAPRAMVEICG